MQQVKTLSDLSLLHLYDPGPDTQQPPFIPEQPLVGVARSQKPLIPVMGVEDFVRRDDAILSDLKQSVHADSPLEKKCSRGWQRLSLKLRTDFSQGCGSMKS